MKVFHVILKHVLLVELEITFGAANVLLRVNIGMFKIVIDRFESQIAFVLVHTRIYRPQVVHITLVCGEHFDRFEESFAFDTLVTIQNRVLVAVIFLV